MKLVAFILLAAVSVASAQVTTCRFYNNADCAVVLNSDDYGKENYWYFRDMANFCASNHAVLTVNVVAGQMASSTWPLLQGLLDKGQVSVGNHSWLHDDRQTYTTNDIPLLNNEVLLAYTAITANLTNIPYMRYNGTNHCLGWAEPGSGWGRSQFCRDVYYTNLVSVGSLVGRSDGRMGSDFVAWNTNYGGGIYYEAPFTIAGNDVAGHRAAFDACLSAHKIYSTYNHAYRPDNWIYSVTNDWNKIIQYVGNRPNVWYVGMGELYEYHYLQTNSNLKIELTENTSNSLINVSIPAFERERFALGYPVTYKYQLPSNWVDTLEILVECIQNGTTNTLPNRSSQEYFSGQNANRVDRSNQCTYISQAFAETGTNFTLVVTPVNMTVSLKENRTNAVVDVSVDALLRGRFTLGYPVTYRYQFPSNWAGVREIKVECVQDGRTNTLPIYNPWGFSVEKATNRVDVSNRCAYISQTFSELGTSFTLLITPIRQGIPAYLSK